MQIAHIAHGESKPNPENIKGWWSRLFYSELPMPSPVTSLAQELIDAIIDAVALNCTSDYLAREALRKCSLVNKTFLPRCRMHLFMEVKLAVQYTTFSQSKRIPRLLQLLEHPLSQIAPYVKTLHLRDAFWEPELPRVLALLRNIHVLHLKMRPGTTSWASLPPAFQDALLQTMTLPTLQDVNVRGFVNLPLSFFVSTGLQRMTLRDSTAEEVPDGRHSETPRPSGYPRPKELNIQDSFPLVLSLFDLSILSPSCLTQVHLISTSSKSVSTTTSLLRRASSTIKKLSFINMADDALPECFLSEFPALQDVYLDIRTSYQENKAGLPSSLRDLFLGLSASSPIRTIYIRIRWCSCNPDIPWNAEALVESWSQVEASLSQLRTLDAVTLAFIVGYNNGKEVWAYEDIVAVENASNLLDKCLGRLLTHTRSRSGVKTRVYREYW